MAIQDSDPERRNLMVTSIAFIAFYFAGGSFPEKSVRLQVINAEFTRPSVLCLIAWIAFFWFIYRYWQTHNGNFTTSSKNEFFKWNGRTFIRKYINRRLNQKLQSDNEEGCHVYRIFWRNGFVVADIQYALSVSRDQGGIVNSWSSGDNNDKKEINLTDPIGWYVAIRATIECLIKEQSFASYIIPYLLGVMVKSGV